MSMKKSYKERLIMDLRQFMKFEVLTLVPFDLDAIEPGLLNEDERRNSTHIINKCMILYHHILMMRDVSG